MIGNFEVVSGLTTPFNHDLLFIICVTNILSSSSLKDFDSSIWYMVGVQSKGCFCRHWLAGIAGSNSAIGLDIWLLWVLCVAQGEVSVTGRSLTQGNPPECDLETSTLRHPRPKLGSSAKYKLGPDVSNVPTWVGSLHSLFPVKMETDAAYDTSVISSGGPCLEFQSW